LLVRAGAALAIIAVVWGWPLAQYPLMLPPSVAYQQAAAGPAVLIATLASLGVGALLILPSLLWLFLLQRHSPYRPDDE
jgi:cytochrome d ubiquinol oxidase subunit II